MCRLLLFSLLAAGFVAGCKKEPDSKPDYSQTIYQTDPSWERVAVVPWQDTTVEETERRFVPGDLQLSSSGALMLAYGQSDISSTRPVRIYRAIADQGGSAVADIMPAGWSVPYAQSLPLLFQQPATNLMFGGCTGFNRFRIFRSDGIAGAETTVPFYSTSTSRIMQKDLGPRFLPHFHRGSGELILDNDEPGHYYFTSVYYAASNRWLDVHKPDRGWNNRLLRAGDIQ